MSDPITFGNTGLTEVKSSEKYAGEGQGMQVVTIYNGPPAAVKAERTRLRRLGIRYDWDDETPSQITVYRDDSADGSDGQNNDPLVNESWNLDWTEISIALMYVDIFLTDGVVDPAVLQAQRDIDYPDPLNPVNVHTKSYGAKGNKYRDKRLRGTDSKTIYFPVITQRILESTKGQVQASNTGVNMVWRLNPNAQLNKLGDLSKWVWRKIPARKDMLRGKIEIQQQYIGAEAYDADLYPPYSGT